MNLLFYKPGTNEAGEQLQRVIEALVPRRKTEIYRTMESLSGRLRQSKYDLAIAVLLAASSEDLMELLSIRDLLDDVRIILVLPDRENDTIRKGHTLRPRFLTYADSNFVDVSAVLSKMLANIFPGKKGK
ncbi:MAG: hypothetical protein JRJ42_11835 [Deltaproteobacteria bacterium]|nr:hypothetical protein [Deltaproteobacteria bacterium]MBW2021230.1 hypothetical protein [Deltaproteobacteria bacterium]